MNKIKFILADLDGTVVLPGAQIASKSVIKSIRDAEKNGAGLLVVTGRPFRMAKDLLKTLGLADPCVFEGGAIIINPQNEEVLWSKPVPLEQTKKSIAILGPLCSRIEYGMGPKDNQDIDIDAISKPALSIWASVPIGVAGGLIQELRKMDDIAVHSNDGPGGDMTRSGIQVTHMNADKEHAVDELLKLDSTDKAHTLAIGDGDNDLPLFKSAKIKIAMGNASEKLKAEADYVVGSVEKDGFAEAIQKYVLN